VQQKTKHGRAPIRARDGLTQQTAGEHVRLRVGDDEKGQRRNNANSKLLFLLLTVATATTILEESHADVLYYGLRIFFMKLGSIQSHGQYLLYDNSLIP